MGSNDSYVEELAGYINAGKHVVVVTGAGLSAASGVPTFRGADNSVWSTSLMEWGTRAKFIEDPLAWYNVFWLQKHYTAMLSNPVPNRGHDAITELSRLGNVTVITQNVDCLHRDSGMAEQDLVEVHGRMGLHKCVQTPGCR
jgi:NAD-dependent SIR2 family protein deacetylase